MVQDVVPGDPVAVVVGIVSNETGGVTMVLGSAGAGDAGGVKVVMGVNGGGGGDDTGPAELVLGNDVGGNGEVVGDSFVGAGAAGVSVFATVFVTVMGEGETGLGFTVEITLVLVVVVVAGDAVTTTVSVTGGDNEVTVFVGTGCTIVSTTVVAVGPPSPPPSMGTTEYVALLGAMKAGDGFSHWRKGSAAQGTPSSAAAESSGKLGFMAAGYMGLDLEDQQLSTQTGWCCSTAESLGEGQRSRRTVSEGPHLKRGVEGPPAGIWMMLGEIQKAGRLTPRRQTCSNDICQGSAGSRGGAGNCAHKYTGGWCCRRASIRRTNPAALSSDWSEPRLARSSQPPPFYIDDILKYIHTVHT